MFLSYVFISFGVKNASQLTKIMMRILQVLYVSHGQSCLLGCYVQPSQIQDIDELKHEASEHSCDDIMNSIPTILFEVGSYRIVVG